MPQVASGGSGMIGKRFGRWVVVAEAAPHVSPSGKRRPRVTCRCDCGTLGVVLKQNLGVVSHSCGCLKIEAASLRKTHGGTGTALYRVWSGMKGRCRPGPSRAQQYYSERGIVVCPEWQEFAAFRDWALSNGYKPGLEIDRIDNDGPYASDNCRWATRRQQCNNMRNNCRVTAFGETRTINEWATDSRCSVAAYVIWNRVQSGWPPEQAITRAKLHSRWERPMNPGEMAAKGPDGKFTKSA